MSMQTPQSQKFIDFAISFDTRAVEDHGQYWWIEQLFKAWIDSDGKNNAVAVTGNDWGVYMQVFVLVLDAFHANRRLLDYNHGGVRYERQVVSEINFLAEEDFGLPDALTREYYQARAAELQQCRCAHRSPS